MELLYLLIYCSFLIKQSLYDNNSKKKNFYTSIKFNNK
jgi:hypothetical protein